MDGPANRLGIETNLGSYAKKEFPAIVGDIFAHGPLIWITLYLRVPALRPPRDQMSSDALRFLQPLCYPLAGYSLSL